jgi:hypothetical protein
MALAHALLREWPTIQEAFMCKVPAILLSLTLLACATTSALPGAAPQSGAIVPAPPSGAGPVRTASGPGSVVVEADPCTPEMRALRPDAAQPYVWAGVTRPLGGGEHPSPMLRASCE